MFAQNFFVILLNVRSALNSVRFEQIYNMIISMKMNILLMQKINVIEKLIEYYEKRHSLITIVTNNIDNRNVTIILNFKIIVWNELKNLFHILYNDFSERFLICSIQYQKIILNVNSIYVSTKIEKRLSWLHRIIQNVKNSLTELYDIIDENWNLTLQIMNKVSMISFRLAHITELQQLLNVLNNEFIDLINEWKIQHFDDRIFIYFIESNKILISKIDRIYIRENWINRTKKWKIKSSELSTNHKITTMIINFAIQTNRESNKWKLQFNLLIKYRIRQKCLKILKIFFDKNSLNEWIIYKIQIVKILIDLNKISKRKRYKLRKNLKRKKFSFQKQRRRNVRLNKIAKNKTLKKLITTIKTRKKHLIEMTHLKYFYTIMIKHFIFNEKFIKWFFAKTKKWTNCIISTLLNENEIKQNKSLIQTNIVTKYYQTLYSFKNFEQAINDEMLSIMTENISKKTCLQTN